MKKMNIFTVGLVGVAMSGLVLTGCTKTTPPVTQEPAAQQTVTSEVATSETAPAEPETAVTENPPVVGGWELYADNSAAMMAEDDSVRIAVALRGEGTNFYVLDLVATQVVSGVNYMYLVYGTDAGATTPGFYFVTIYEETNGDASVLGIKPIDITAIETAEPLGKGATGAWAVQGTGKAGMLPDENAMASFDAINTGDVIYNPVALLGTQVVSGKNYKAICRGSDENLYVVTWYADLQGNSSLTSAECVNIGAYSGL
ncbi:MAG: hypothetical protein K5879_07395 [Lachnospiraceae bacterium]|nr:hypothetical protein [Lachnospiraceae bacterium]